MPGARLSHRTSFFLQASIIVFFLAGSAAPTPLYAVYKAAWGFSPTTVTLIFGIYAIAVLSALLVVGGLSDYIGRRPVLLAAALMQAVAMVVFIVADGVGALVIARVIQGLSTGAAAGAVGAALLDLDRERGTVANAIGPMLGTAVGSLLSGLFVIALPAPTVTIYVLLAAVFVLQAVGLAFVGETAQRRPGAFHSLRPHFALPPRLRGPMLVAAPALIAAWALPGFYGSLGPVLVAELTGSRSLALGGITLAVQAASAVVMVLMCVRREARAVMFIGCLMLALGTAATLVAIVGHWVVLFFVGSVIAGAGFGASFQGALRTVVSLAAPNERAGVLSVVYVVAYLAMGVPAVFAGLRAAAGDVESTAIEYSGGVIALVLAALLGMFLRRPAVALERT